MNVPQWVKDAGENIKQGVRTVWAALPDFARGLVIGAFFGGIAGAIFVAWWRA